jgi:Spy/CpxP family protein refolding chaperone
MKRSSEVLLFAAALAVAALVPQLNAQDNPPAPGKGPRGPRPEMMLIEHAKELGLTDAQITQIKAIHEAARPQLEAIRADQALTREQKREKAQALMKDSRAKVEAILTPEQREKAKAIGKEMREHAKGHHGGKGPHGPGGPDDQDGPPPPPEGK